MPKTTQTSHDILNNDISNQKNKLGDDLTSKLEALKLYSLDASAAAYRKGKLVLNAPFYDNSNDISGNDHNGIN
ncbi:MAG: hypothetical protein V4496_06580, partial [Pseudomonadota bacterium]